MGGPQNWLWLTAPIRGCGLNPVFGLKDKIRNELYDRATPEQCRAVFDALYALRQEFEAAYGRQVEWYPLEERKALDEAAVGPLRDAEPHKGHHSDIGADGLLDPRFLRRPAGPRPVPVKPGAKQLAGQLPAADEGGPDMPPEDRCAVIAATRMQAPRVSAVLPEPPRKLAWLVAVSA